MVYLNSSPMKAIQTLAPKASVSFVDGDYPSAAAAAARGADVVIVFATQWMTEGGDAPDLTLPNGQDQTIAAVAAANPNTVVVLETGGPVLMPWLDKVGAVLEAWYPGHRGGEAIANVLFGRVDASGRLPISFPAAESQLPRPAIPGAGLPAETRIDVDYDIEGSDVGYRWYSRRGLKPQFPFGHGLSYTRFAYDGLTVSGGRTLTVSVQVTNTGDRAGVDTPQAYLVSRAGHAQQRLIGFSRIALKPGEGRRVTMTADPRLLADFDTKSNRWKIAAGRYEAAVGRSAGDLVLKGAAQVDGAAFDDRAATVKAAQARRSMP